MTRLLAERPLLAAVIGGLVAWLVVWALQFVVLHRTAIADLAIGSLLFAASAVLLLLVAAANTPGSS